MEIKNRKYVVLVVSCIVVVTIGLFFFLFRDKLTESIQQFAKDKKVEQPVEKLLETRCDFADDQSAYTAAMQKVNPAFCSCIQDERVKTRCDAQALETLKFQRIVKQLDAARCKEFSDEPKQKLCAQAIAGRLEVMANDPLILASNYLEEGNYAQAAEVLNKAIKLDDQNADTLLMLALTYANQGLAEHKEGEYVPKALALVEKALALKLDNPEAYRVRGFINETMPDYDAAYDDYTKAIELNANFILAYVGRGHVANMSGQIGNALNDFKTAKNLDKDKTYPQIYAQLCRLESQGPMLEDAIADCVINVEMTNGMAKAEAHGMLASLQIRAGQLEEAGRNARMAIVLAPNNPNVYLTASEASLQAGDGVAAQQYAEKAISLDKTRAMAYIQLAGVLLQQNQASASIEKSLQALSLIDQDVAILKPEKLAAKQRCYRLLVDAYLKQSDNVNAEKYRQMQTLPSEE